MSDSDLQEMNIVDALFVKYPHYIVLLSGLLPEIEAVAESVAKDLGFTHLCFTHINPVAQKADLKAVNKRVNELIDSKKQGLIICGPTFPQDDLDFRVDAHIHLSITKTMAAELKQPVDYEQYIEGLASNRVNKYINIKPGYTPDAVGDIVFDYVISNINSKVHPRKGI